MKKVKGIDHTSRPIYPKRLAVARLSFVSSFYFFFPLSFPSSPPARDLYEQKKKVFLFSRHPRTHARFRCPMTSSGQPVGSISLLVEDSTVAVLCFAAKGKKRKESRGIWVWDDVMMTEFKKRSIIFSSRTVSLVCLSKCASRWNCFATFRHRWKLIRRSNRHGISALRCPVPCKRTPQVLSNRPEFGITLSIVGSFLSLDVDRFIISAMHASLVILERINKNTWYKYGISQRVQILLLLYVGSDRAIVLVNK